MYMKIPGFIEIDAGHKPDCECVDEIELVNCKKVGARTFENCRWLKKISLPECTEVGDEAFFGCTQLTEVSIPKCEIIGYGAFTGCGIKEIVLPSCTQLADFAFQGCTKLEKIDLPVCKNIGFAIAGNYGGNVSINCPQWEKIVSYYSWAYSHSWRKAFTALLGESCLRMVPKVVELPICTSVADGIFSGCSHLRKIDMPKCKTIGVESFYRCSGLEEVNLPTCSSVGKNAFSGCENLKEIHFAKESRGKIVGLSDSGLTDRQCFYDL